MRNLLARRHPRLPPLVWLLLLLAHALACTHALRTGHYQFPDSGRYLQAAENISQHGQLYARPWPARPPTGQAVQEFTIRPPGYPLLVLVLGAPVGILLLQNALSISALALVLGDWVAGRARPPGAKSWALALLLAFSFPAQLIYANALMSEIPLQALVLLGVALGATFRRTHRARYLAAAAATLVAAWLLKPVCYPFTLVFLGISGWLAWRQRRPALAAIGAVPLLLALAYMGWNWQRTSYFHFSSIADINLLHYNAAGVLRQAQGPTAEAAWVAQTLQRANAQPTFAARQHVMEAEATAVLRRYPVRYAGQHLLGMATFFLDPGRFDMSVFGGETRSTGLLEQLRSQGLAGVGQVLARQPVGLLVLLIITALANALRLALALRGLLRPAPPAWPELDKPATSNEKPATSNEQPATSNQQPATSNQQRPDWLGLDTAAGRWLAAGLLLYLALLTGPLGAARFLVPGWPLLLVLALRGLPPAAPSPGPAPARP